MSNYSPIQAMIDRQAEVWRRNQEAYLAAWEATVNSWLKHSQEAIAAAAETAEQASRCNDLGTLAELQQEWFAGALARLTADMTALAENAMTLSQRSLGAVAALSEEPGTPPGSEAANNGAWAITSGEKKAQAEAPLRALAGARMNARRSGQSSAPPRPSAE
jgi:hypothetical protein